MEPNTDQAFELPKVLSIKQSAILYFLIPTVTVNYTCMVIVYTFFLKMLFF
jgi:hypothetical protein